MNLPRTLGALALFAVAACEPYGQSKVAHGQLYTPGQPAYDDYFRSVHAQQVDAAGWADDRKQAHKALVAALDLTPDAPDVTIIQATHEAASKLAKGVGSLRLDVDGTNAHVIASGGASDAPPLFRAVEETARAELDRARRMHGVEPKLDALSKQGTDLEGRSKEDWKTRGVGKQTEVDGELVSSLRIVSDLKSRAEREARASEDFVADVDRALETASEERAAKQRDRHKPKKDKGDKPDHDEAPKAAPKPAPAPAAEAPAPKPAPPPPPKPADTGEVFTP